MSMHLNQGRFVALMHVTFHFVSLPYVTTVCTFVTKSPMSYKMTLIHILSHISHHNALQLSNEVTYAVTS
jgi:hypothetical protein